MTVTFVTPPGRLADTLEPIVFTATEPVLAVSAEFRYEDGNGLWWETVYQDGRFSHAYASSIIAGTQWTVRRSTPWPADLRVLVDEKPAPPPPPINGQGWGVIFESNLLETPRNFTTLGSYAIAGATWWLKGAFGPTPGGYVSTAFTDANGLNIRCNGGGDMSATGLQWFMPLSQFAAFNASAPVMVLGCVKKVASGGAYPRFGVVATDADASPTIVDVMPSRMVLGATYAPSAAVPQLACRISSLNQSLPLDVGTYLASQLVMGAAVWSTSRGTFQAFPWNGSSAPNPVTALDLPSGASVNVNTKFAPVISMAKLGALFSGESGSGYDTVTLRRIYVLQPKVAA